MSRLHLILACLLAFPAAAQQAAEVPGDPARWYAARTVAAANRRPDLDALKAEAIDRARWSTTTAVCEAPITDLKLYGLEPATADRLVASGILAGAFVGGWTFYAETGCPQTPLLRYLYIAETDGRHLLFVVNRGEAISTPSMMRETSAIAGARAFYFAKERAPACEVGSVGMRATEVAATDGDLSAPLAGTRFAGGWTERWRFTACGMPVEVDIRFDADGKGGSKAEIVRTALAG